MVLGEAPARGADGRDQARPQRGNLVRGGGHGGVPDEGEPTTPGWKLKAHGQGEEGTERR